MKPDFRANDVGRRGDCLSERVSCADRQSISRGHELRAQEDRNRRELRKTEKFTTNLTNRTNLDEGILSPELDLELSPIRVTRIIRGRKNFDLASRGSAIFES